MKKVFVQVPCLNEAETIESVIKGIPKKIDGVDLQILIIDDGCTDDTVKIARALGVKHCNS
jgi:glycosyltransferase involved in cell wall biosynthesis